MTVQTVSRTTHDALAIRAGDPATRPWHDQINLVIAMVVVLTPLWTTAELVSWFVPLGVIGFLVAVWALVTSSSRDSEKAMIAVGAVLCATPWLGGFSTHAGAAWTAWIAGVALMVFAAVGIIRSGRP
ncbi:SPW repeat domain-containing protein [Corynebacterium comes]|uniref:SPW repeat-containing integral membrane domain-containing protein n=1 Tax=Corynebacterium comes TaxID=2675218 RepID=A0A6B8VPX7_9CORY|nr:SPW repeat protein [Corynebacterium comes]QGU03464.1 hypothetical protein CETAM_00855 [Corynebacterium comes]